MVSDVVFDALDGLDMTPSSTLDGAAEADMRLDVKLEASGVSDVMFEAV